MISQLRPTVRNNFSGPKLQILSNPRKNEKTHTDRNYSQIQYKGYNSKSKFFDGVQFRKYFISLPAFYLNLYGS